jgi:hypothetical protein
MNSAARDTAPWGVPSLERLKPLISPPLTLRKWLNMKLQLVEAQS